MMQKALLMAAAAGSALAFNSHRHGQHHVDRREAQAEVTVYETVIVTAGQDAPAPSVEAVANEQSKEVYNEAPVVEVVPTPDAVAEPQQTTLATAVRPAATDDQWTSNGQADTDSVSVQGVSSSKRGMCYNDVNLAQTFGSKCAKCTWAYNWDSESYGLDTKYSFVPMLWGNLDIHTNRWKKNADAAIARGSKAVLSFNEPDHGGQAAMTPAQAAAAHNKWMNPYGGKVLVGAPAVTNSGNEGEGLKWLKNFFDACNNVSGGCKVDFCPVHWYSEAQYGDTLIKHIQDAHTICGGKPIWLTEFAPLGTDQQKADFLTKYLPKLDAISYLDHYSYFMVASNNLMSGNSALSVYGQKYATL